jgi:hypothetical protein
MAQIDPKRPVSRNDAIGQFAGMADIGPAWVSVMKKRLAEPHGSL